MDEFEQAYARALAAAGDDVDGAASVLAAAGDTWDRVAGRVTGRVLRECAGRGWEPADLVRMAGRELTPRHQRLAAALGETSLTDFAAAERLDRFRTAVLLVEVLCLYGRLPRITAPQRPATPAPTGSAGKMLGRVRALLAKAESTGFPEEAEALSAKAQHLMARHSIDAALLAATHGSDAGAPGGPGFRRIGVDRPYEGAKALLLDAVAVANRCEAVWSGDFGFSTVVGYEADLDAVELLYTSLLVQADRALGAARSREFRESFLIAYAGRIRGRLVAATEAEVGSSARAEGELLPALAARDLAVRTARRRLFPTTTTSRLKARDEDGWQAGRSAADRARF
ncbi:DUF2786 domain-containing protein [Streptomyces sp. CA-111067]|uniref:DUF2786 domain-containing protein n=1 Tax=Streptomyces sp. CA-111067 TaxID=3240046 RepID=UPI003D9932AF